MGTSSAGFVAYYLINYQSPCISYGSGECRFVTLKVIWVNTVLTRKIPVPSGESCVEITYNRKITL